MLSEQKNKLNEANEGNKIEETQIPQMYLLIISYVI